jgi:tRNA-dihydrouridine synthase B
MSFMNRECADEKNFLPTRKNFESKISFPFFSPLCQRRMRIGTHVLRNNLFVAPMAGVTDAPFRNLCKSFGAGLAVSEMVASDTGLRFTEKSRRRTDHSGESPPISVQIAGAEPAMMAEAARYNADRGAEIVDINMGCPAKKVCNKAAGSALLRDEVLVARILSAVVAAVDVPVTLKIRTGWDPENRNAARVAKIAEENGIQALAVHGRTRACGFGGHAEYETIRVVKRSTTLPVIANGDITTPEEARQVLDYTGADGVMIGRAAQGRPWIFREIEHYLANGRQARPPTVEELRAALQAHLEALYRLYGRELGVKVARKHVGWYTKKLAGAAPFRAMLNQIETCDEQLAAVMRFCDELAQEQQAV